MSLQSGLTTIARADGFFTCFIMHSLALVRVIFKMFFNLSGFDKWFWIQSLCFTCFAFGLLLLVFILEVKAFYELLTVHNFPAFICTHVNLAICQTGSHAPESKQCKWTSCRLLDPLPLIPLPPNFSRLVCTALEVTVQTDGSSQVTTRQTKMWREVLTR